MLPCYRVNNCYWPLYAAVEVFLARFECDGSQLQVGCSEGVYRRASALCN